MMLDGETPGNVNHKTMMNSEGKIFLTAKTNIGESSINHQQTVAGFASRHLSQTLQKKNRITHATLNCNRALSQSTTTSRRTAQLRIHPSHRNPTRKRMMRDNFCAERQVEMISNW